MKINPVVKIRQSFSGRKTKNSQSESNFYYGVNPSIFKAYDIRGVYPEEVNENIAYLVGRAFVEFLKKKKPNIVVGRDARLSSPKLFSSLVKGITEQGGNVIDIGLSTTPMLYWVCAYFKYDGGVNITASHNPWRYNGFKLTGKGAISISGESGLESIKKSVIDSRFKNTKKGKAKKKNVLNDYIKFNIQGFDLKKIKPFKIVLDTANAVPGIVAPEIFKKTNCKIYHLFSKLDGTFPNHDPDPLVRENLEILRRQVKLKKADLGAAFDGDGDRISFIDEKGEVVAADLIGALISKIILEKNPSEKILYDIRSSNIIKETVEKAGGVPRASRIGHSFIKEKMHKENIIFAGEFSGHYYHKEHYFCEAPFFVLLKILEELSQTKKSLSQLLMPFKKYFHSGELNFRVKNPKEVLKTLENKFKKGKISKIDGLRVDFGDWWFNARPSNTEPVLRAVVEAKTKELMEKRKKELVALIENS